MKKVNLRNTPEYKKFGYSIVRCPVCGEETLDTHYICPNCGWEYDEILDDRYSCANGSTVAEYRENMKIPAPKE